MPYRPPESSNIILNDQTRVPAAMRTNLLFGDVRFEDDVKTAKEIERRQWLDDLQKQIEENKRQKYTQQETERRQDFLHKNVHPLIQEAANRHQQQNDTYNHFGQNPNKFNQTYETEQSDKRAQLIDKLKRNGYQTDLLEKPNVTIETLYCPLDCHLAVCSPDVLHLFKDNFDFLTINDFVKGK